MLRLNVFALRTALESHLGHRVPLRVIADATGISQNTLSGMVRGVPRHVDLAQLEALLAYFRAQGLQVEAGDLLTEGDAPAPAS